MQIKLNKISQIPAEIFKKLGKNHRFEPIFWEIFKNLLMPCAHFSMLLKYMKPIDFFFSKSMYIVSKYQSTSRHQFEQYFKSNQCAFDAYCKVILRNEARDAYDQRKRKLKREQLFGEMSPEELNKLITTDRYFQFERDIVEDGLHFIVCDQGVYDALMTLPGAKRKIVLLSYFGEMNDREIGDALGTGRANVQYHRSRALAMMRKTLEQESEEY